MESILRTTREIYLREEERGETTVYFVCSKCSLPYRTANASVQTDIGEDELFGLRSPSSPLDQRL
jgi:hypothetical protein